MHRIFVASLILMKSTVFELCCQADVLEDTHTRNAFDKVESATGLDVKMRLEKLVGLREAAKELSVASCQGMLLVIAKRAFVAKALDASVFLTS